MEQNVQHVVWMIVSIGGKPTRQKASKDVENSAGHGERDNPLSAQEVSLGVQWTSGFSGLGTLGTVSYDWPSAMSLCEQLVLVGRGQGWGAVGDGQGQGMVLVLVLRDPPQATARPKGGLQKIGGPQPSKGRLTRSRHGGSKREAGDCTCRH